MNYNLNYGQKLASEAFFEFLFDEFQKEFIISGAAGVGKTYLMGYLIDVIMPRYAEMCKMINMIPNYTGVTMTATTNKAADVLGHNTNRPTSTVHSFFGLTVKENYEDGKTFLKKTNNWRVHNNLILFVDEASMIDSDLWHTIHEGTFNCKLVYVGDQYQLAPVHETLSPIYRQGSPLYELTEPMRNSGQPALMAVCDQLRHTVATGEFSSIRIVPGVIDHLDDSTMQQEITNRFQQQTFESRILAYTNKRVIEYNDFIRKAVRNLPDHPMVGEYLVNNSSFKWQTKTLAVEAEIEIIKNHGHQQVYIDKGVLLTVNHLDLKDKFGRIWEKVPMAADRDHYTALIKYYQKAKNWERYFHLKNDYADLRPRDAATVHKSQGSTYDSVFIDLGDISTCRNPAQASRLLYVAFSRARNRVFLYGKLADRFGGLITP